MWPKACGMCPGGRILEILSRYPTENNKGTKTITHLHHGVRQFFLPFCKKNKKKNTRIKLLLFLLGKKDLAQIVRQTKIGTHMPRPHALQSSEKQPPSRLFDSSYPLMGLSNASKTDGHQSSCKDPFPSSSSMPIFFLYFIFLYYRPKFISG